MHRKGGTTMSSRVIVLIATLGLACAGDMQAQQAPAAAKKPNILTERIFLLQ
jgi:hypothetical protein